jgi:hypothetical protein
MYFLTRGNKICLNEKLKTVSHNYCKSIMEINFFKYIQGVSETRVLILTSGRTRQFMKLFSKIRKSFPGFFAPKFLPKSRFV